MIRVRVTVKGGAPQDVDVDRELLVGRKPPADVVVADGEVSSKHAKLRPDGSKLMVTDLASTNGSKIGDAKLPPNVETELPAGKQLHIGPAVIEVREVIETLKPESSVNFASVEKTVAIGGGAMQSVLVNVARFKAAQPRLVVAAEHDRRVVPIEGMDVVVGRDGKQAQVVLGHQSISAKHAKIRFENGRFLVEDLKSVNGTFVDGNPVAVATPIQGEQAVTFGTVDCLFVEKAAESGDAASGANDFADALCAHAARLGKATGQQAKEVLAEHRRSGASLGLLFVERGIMNPKEWAEIWRQRQIIGTLAPLAGKKDGGLAKIMGIAVVALGLAALAYFVLRK